MTLAALLGAALAASLVALAGSLREVYRLRRLLREERQHSDWQAAIIGRRGWRRDAGRTEPKGRACGGRSHPVRDDRVEGGERIRRGVAPGAQKSRGYA